MLVVHLIEATQNSGLNPIYKEIFLDMQQKSGGKILICSPAEEWTIQYKELDIISISYSDTSELLHHLQSYQDPDIIVTTFSESFVSLCHQLKHQLGQIATPDPDLFLNKGKQRASVAQRPEYCPQTLVLPAGHTITESETAHLCYPLIIKPIGGVGSRGVQRVHNFTELKTAIQEIQPVFAILDDKDLHHKQIIIEEYITGPQYVFNYYVDQEGNSTLSLPTHVLTLQDAGIDDFGNRIRLITPDIYGDLDMILLHDIITKTIQGGQIRNTYISHNIKITPSGHYKTIETNGRIGGYRLEMNWLASRYNLFDPLIGIAPIEPIPIRQSVATISIWPRQSGVLTDFNTEAIQTIQSLPSHYRSSYHHKYKKRAVGLARDGFSPLGTIILINNDHTQFLQDLEQVKQLYHSLVNLQS